MTAGKTDLDSNPEQQGLVTMPGSNSWISRSEVSQEMTSNPEVTCIYKEVTCCHCGFSHQCCQPMQDFNDTVGEFYLVQYSF